MFRQSIFMDTNSKLEINEHKKQDGGGSSAWFNINLPKQTSQSTLPTFQEELEYDNKYGKLIEIGARFTCMPCSITNTWLNIA